MTSARLGRDLHRLRHALDDFERDHGGWTRVRTMKRVMSGERRWSELCLLFEPVTDGWHEELMAALPGALLARHRGGRPSNDPGTVLNELAAHVPGEPLPASCRWLLNEAEDGWRSPQFEICLYWAPIRQIFGADEGASLRLRCWDRQEKGWRPSQAVLRAVRARGSNMEQGCLARLMGPCSDAEGRVYKLKAVMPGGRIEYTLEKEAKTSH